MGARLAATVLVKDPETHQTVELPKGSTPEPRLAALVTNPAAWEGGKVPAAVRKAAEAANDDGGDNGGQGNGDGGTTPPPGLEQSGDSGDTSPAGDADTPAEAPAEAEPTPAPKTPAKKTAAKRSATSGDAAAEGAGGK